MEDKEIPELHIKLDERIVKGGLYNNRMRYQRLGIFGKVKFIWNWYWFESDKISWLNYLKSLPKITYSRELPLKMIPMVDIDAEVENTKE